jgi:hypothetical protein
VGRRRHAPWSGVQLFPGRSFAGGHGAQVHFTGTTVLRLQGGLIVEELGLDDGVMARMQLGLVKKD